MTGLVVVYCDRASSKVCSSRSVRRLALSGLRPSRAVKEPAAVGVTQLDTKGMVKQKRKGETSSVGEASDLPASSICKKSAAALQASEQVWPGGSKWLPDTKHWGTRNPAFFGCGKCRWYPQGCRGCRIASESYVARVPHVWLTAGEVRLPEQGSDGTSKTELKEREEEMTELMSKLHVVSGTQQSDPHGFGVIAAPTGRRLRRGQVIKDPSVFYVARPASYAAAHLPPFHAIEVEGKGRVGYWRLREASFGHCSLTYYVNDASMSGKPPNCEYHTHRDRRYYDEFFSLRILTDIEPGEELLAAYDTANHVSTPKIS